MAVSQRPVQFTFSLIGSVPHHFSIAERSLPSGSSSREYVQSPIWILNVGNEDNRPRFVPHPHSAIAEPDLFSQRGFPFGFPDPLGLATGQPRFKQ